MLIMRPTGIYRLTDMQNYVYNVNTQLYNNNYVAIMYVTGPLNNVTVYDMPYNYTDVVGIIYHIGYNY